MTGPPQCIVLMSVLQTCGVWSVSGGLEMENAIAAKARPTAVDNHDRDCEENDPNPMLVNNSICGPRCVQHILKIMGRDDELLKLIDEIQSNEVEASLEALKIALERRGIASYPVHVNDIGQCRNLLMILHLCTTNETRDVHGHFCVLEPTTAGDVRQVTIWDGLAGRQALPIDELKPALSGSALLVPIGRVQEGNCYSSVFKELGCEFYTTVIGPVLSLFVLTSFLLFQRNRECRGRK